MQQATMRIVTGMAWAAALAIAPAHAAHYDVGGVLSGTSTLTGGVLIASLPCYATFTVSVNGGVAAITAAAFSGSTACLSVQTNLGGATTWPLAAPTSPSGPGNVQIANVLLRAPAPIGMTCSGTLIGTLSAGQFTFNNVLPPGCPFKSNPSMASSPTLGAVYP